MSAEPQAADRRRPLDVSVAGGFLAVAALWDLLFNRLASSLGMYLHTGAEGPLSVLAGSGRLAMNATGITALLLACATLPRLLADQRFASLPWKVLVLFSSACYLPVVGVAIFRPVSPRLVLAGYLVAACSALLMASLAAAHKIGGGRRRIVLALGLIQLLGAFELAMRLHVPATDGIWAVLPRRSYLLAEVLFATTPVFALLVLRPGPLRGFLRRPHLTGVAVGLAALAVAAAVVVSVESPSQLSLVAFRSLGITMSIPGGAIVYMLGLGCGALLVGSLLLPSRRWPPDDNKRRMGLGLTCIWCAGLQPTHPYLFILMLTGFVMLARGLVGEAPGAAPAGLDKSPAKL